MTSELCCVVFAIAGRLVEETELMCLILVREEIPGFQTTDRHPYTQPVQHKALCSPTVC